MFNNQKIRELEQRLERLEGMDVTRGIREANLKYDIKRNIITDLGFRNQLENNVASDVMIRLSDDECELSVKNLIKREINSLQGIGSKGYIDYMAHERLSNLQQITKIITGEDWVILNHIDKGAMIYEIESPIFQGSSRGYAFSHRSLMDNFEKVTKELVNICFDYMKVKRIREVENV